MPTPPELHRRGHFARRQRFDITNDLPPLLFCKECPRRHPVVLVAFGDEPKNFSLAHPLQLAVYEGRNVPGSLAGLAVTCEAISRIKRFSRINGGLLTFDRILLRLGRIRSVMEVFVGRLQACD